MQSFLEEVATHVIEHYPEETGDICIVTPNRRAGLFLLKHFSAKVKKTTWAPVFMSIEDFVNRISGCRVADNLSLLFHFFEAYRNLEKENADDIDEFLRWGSVLLRDFDEIDAALEDPSALFTYVRDLKYIETWNPEGAPLTEFQKNYLAFFEKLPLWHRALKKHLDKENLAYQGMSYRKAAAKLKADPENLPWKKIIFAGFNALNQAEENIIDSLVKAGKGEFLADSDPYYENNPQHEAGYFIRKYRPKWMQPVKDGKPSWFSQKKNIRVLGIARNLTQAQLAGNILEYEKEIPLNDQTAIVLANEDLLVPVLNALPDRAASINVTMGYPLAKTNLFGFFEALLQLFLTAHRLNKAAGDGPVSFHYKDLLRFFSNSCAAVLWDRESGQEKTGLLIRKIGLSNRSFYSFKDLVTLSENDQEFQSTFYFLSENWAVNIDRVLPALRQICGKLDRAFRQKAGSDHEGLKNSPFFIDFESLYYFGRILTRLESLTGSNPAIDNLRTLWFILKQSVAESRLAFSGEPLEGLQVMGVLETRNLDFRNVILLSANEDIIPRGKTNNSFIPFEVKRKFGLQVHSEKDAVFGYHFYRLLQRAENVFLIYNAEAGGMGSGEKSRFITQLEYELPAFNPEVKIVSELISLSPAVKTKEKEITIRKTPEVMERLYELARTGFSPSSLNTYIRCPLKFYLEKVARIREPEEVEETIEASTLGSVVHGVLEDLYCPHKGQVINAGHIRAMQGKVHELTVQRFEAHYPEGDITSGKNLLLFSLSKRFVENFLTLEAAQADENQAQGKTLTLIDIEASLKASKAIAVNGRLHEIWIMGKADRIDRLGDVIRVIDYKTGKVELSHLKVDDFEKITEDAKYEKAFQVLGYTWLYLRANPAGESPVESGIFSMRNLKSGFLKSTFNGNDSEAISAFEEQLKLLLTRILDQEQPFMQTSKQENCRYCPFQAMCGRFESNENF